MAKDLKLTKKDRISVWIRSFFLQGSWNYERMQNGGWAFAMIPAIKRLYKTKEEQSAALKRHLEFFNTHPYVASPILGVTLALEEERANGGDVDADAIRNLKTALMGPLAGIGDTVTQSLVKVILLGVGIDMAKNGNPMGPILFVILFSVYAIGVSRFLFFRGYKLGKESVVKLLSGGMVKRVTESLGVVGMAVLGALVAKNIGVTTPLDFHIGEMEIVMQDLLDSIIPKLIPLVIFLIVYRQLKKGKKPTTVMVYMMIASVILSLLGILA